MPPYSITSSSSTKTKTFTKNKNTLLLSKNDNILNESFNYKDTFLWIKFKSRIIWINVFLIAFVHYFALITFLTFPYGQRFHTILFNVFYGSCGGFGVTAGAHRLWCHKSYKAKNPLKIILIICYAIAGQNKLFDWVRDHRVHHKYSETDADPHNSKRGFFFSHVGWLMLKKHPDVINNGRNIDCNDLLQDPILMFHDNYFIFMKMIFCFIVPSIIPVFFWNETWYWSIMTTCFARYATNLNCTWLVNSAAHMYGTKPYDKNISPVENMTVSFLAMGEGWHNYHHTFPWDYKAAELGNYYLNVTTFFLDLFGKIGWAYDMKTPSQELIQRIANKNGDGTHNNIWGSKVFCENGEEEKEN